MGTNMLLSQEGVLRVEMEDDIINIEKIKKTLEKLNIIKINLNRIDELRNEYMRTADVQSEQMRKREITDLTNEISIKINQASDALKSLKEDNIKKAEKFNVKVSTNTELRMENTIIIVFQAQLYKLIKKSSFLQKRVKDSYEEKMRRQLAIHAPNIEENQMKELMSQPEVK